MSDKPQQDKTHKTPTWIPKFNLPLHCPILTRARCDGSKGSSNPDPESSGSSFLSSITKYFQGFFNTQEELTRTYTEVDLYRDTPVRLLGYANEVGESFRPIIPVWIVRASYLVASGYVVADTLDKSGKVSRAKWSSEKERSSEVKKAIADTLVWQTLASVVIPGFTINRACYFTLTLMNKAAKVPQVVRNWTTVVICLSLIPLIVKPIDHSVDYMLDRSLRKYLDRKTPPV